VQPGTTSRGSVRTGPTARADDPRGVARRGRLEGRSAGGAGGIVRPGPDRAPGPAAGFRTAPRARGGSSTKGAGSEAASRAPGVGRADSAARGDAIGRADTSGASGGLADAGAERAQVVAQSEDRGSLQRFLTPWRGAIAAIPGRQVRWSLDVDPLGFA